MAWTLSDDVESFVAAAWEFLARDPITYTVALTVTNAIQHGVRWSEAAPVFAWHSGGGGVDGAALMTPPFPLLLAELPASAAADLARVLLDTGVRPSGANGRVAEAAAFGESWRALTGSEVRTAMRQRLYRLDRLRPPPHSPDGGGRLAGAGDVETAGEWFVAFGEEAEHRRVDASDVPTRIDEGRLWVWEDAGGRTVAMAARSPVIAGAARVGPVYTPPAHRRRGYGAAVTARCSEAALRAGAGEVVLFTDLANPTSNSIYRQIGYVPVDDRAVLEFADPV